MDGVCGSEQPARLVARRSGSSMDANSTLEPLFNFRFEHPVRPGGIVVATLDGTPSVAVPTAGGKICLKFPHSTADAEGELIPTRLLNVNRPVQYMIAGHYAKKDRASYAAIARGDPTASRIADRADMLFVASSENVVALDVARNTEAFAVEYPEGVASLAFGTFALTADAHAADTPPLLFVGGPGFVRAISPVGEEMAYLAVPGAATALELAPIGPNRQPMLLVGTDRSEIHFYNGRTLSTTVTESGSVVRLESVARLHPQLAATVYGGVFCVALRDGTVSAYDGTARLWQHSQAAVAASPFDTADPGAAAGMSRCASVVRLFDIDGDGVPEVVFVAAASDGYVVASFGLRLGEPRMTLRRTAAVLLLGVGDLIGNGAAQLFLVSTDGAVEAFGLFTDAEDAVAVAQARSVESELAALVEKRDVLQRQLQHYDEALSVVAKAAESAFPSDFAASVDVRPAEGVPTLMIAVNITHGTLHEIVVRGTGVNAPVQASVGAAAATAGLNGGVQSAAVGAKIGGSKASSASALPADADTKSTAVAAAASTAAAAAAFYSPDHLAAFAPFGVSTRTLSVYTSARTGTAIELTIFAYVSPQDAPEVLQVLELKQTVLPFARFVRVPPEAMARTNAPAGYVDVVLGQRPARVLRFLSTSFTHTATAPVPTATEESLKAAYRSVIDGTLVTFDATPRSVKVGCDDLELAGQLVQAMAAAMELGTVSSTCNFPDEFAALEQATTAMAAFDATRLRMTAQIAAEAETIKLLVVRAEDARLHRDLHGTRQHTVRLAQLNRDLLADCTKRAANHAELVSCLSNVAAFIQKGAALRVGKPAETVRTASYSSLRSIILL